MSASSPVAYPVFGSGSRQNDDDLLQLTWVVVFDLPMESNRDKLEAAEWTHFPPLMGRREGGVRDVYYGTLERKLNVICAAQQTIVEELNKPMIQIGWP